MHHPELEINLDDLLNAGQDFSQLHKMLAQANGVDTYSYLYEVMEACDIEFSEASGLAAEYLDDQGQFDFEGFSQSWKQQQSHIDLLLLARRHMKISTLEEIEGLEAALRAAYQAGVDSRSE